MSEVNVISRTQKIIVDSASQSVAIISSGPAGPGGPPGDAGEHGDPGEPGGSLLSAFWQYSSNTAAPPASGQMRVNVGVTTLWVHETDTDGFTRAFGLGTILSGSAIYVRAANGSVMDLEITDAPVDNGTYWTFPVTKISTTTATPGSRTQLNFIAAGNVGIPPGGTEDQVLAKTSGDDYEVAWVDPPSSGGGGTTILDGTSVPPAGYGATGNYYEEKTNGILYGPKLAEAYGAEQILVVPGTIPGGGVAGYESGMYFSCERAGRITKIRYSRHSTDNPTQWLRLWNNDAAGAKLSEVSDTRSTTGQYTVTLPTPILVPAGGIRCVSISATTGTSPQGSWGGTPVATTDLTFLSSRRIGGFDVFPSGIDWTGGIQTWVEPVYEPEGEVWPVTVRTMPGYTPMVVKATEPTAADYGLATIPTNAIWIEV